MVVGCLDLEFEFKLGFEVVMDVVAAVDVDFPLALEFGLGFDLEGVRVFAALKFVSATVENGGLGISSGLSV